MLTQNDTDASNASTTATKLGKKPDYTFSGISSATTVNAVTGTDANGYTNLTVVNINGSISLNNASLTLTGTASDVFVVNVTGNTVSFVGTGGLMLSGGVTPNHVLYNFTGSGTIASHVGNEFYGTLLAPGFSYNLDGSFVGEIIGGGSSITLLSNATVNVNGVLPNTATVSATGVSAQSASAAVTVTLNNSTNTNTKTKNSLTLTAPSGTVAYTPAQVRDAYGINVLSQDGTGQTIAIVEAYDDPAIYQSVDQFDAQFSLIDSGSTILEQYGAASSFLTVLDQAGQAGSPPSTDPSGVGTDNWEVEAALDVEWAHAIAPGAQIILVEANSQSLSDLMAAVGTAAAQPGVSVVTMSWGFPEGQSVFAADEANYDSVFNVPGVTFLASTGDYGTSDPEYPAFSPNVVAVGGTSLTLNSDNSYNSETGWGYYSDSMGTSIGSGGGLEPVRVRAVVPAGRPVHRQPDHARRLAGRRSGHRRLDRRLVQPRSEQSVRGRGRHQPVGAGLRGPDRPGQPGSGRRGRGRAQ